MGVGLDFRDDSGGGAARLLSSGREILRRATMRRDFGGGAGKTRDVPPI